MGFWTSLGPVLTLCLNVPSKQAISCNSPELQEMYAQPGVLTAGETLKTVYFIDGQREIGWAFLTECAEMTEYS